MSEWQPIETVLKDGTPVDLWAKRWLADSDTFISVRFANFLWVPTLGKFRSERGQGLFPIEWRPTHWKPLPEPPE